MRDDNLRPMWSETELDAALAALRSDVDTEEDTLTAVRAELIAAAGGPTERENPMTVTIAPISQEVERPRKPRWGTLTAVAATVAALAAGAVFVTTQGTGDTNPAAGPNAGIEVDLGNGHKITVDQPTLAPGQYRLQESHGWSGATHVGADVNDVTQVRQEGFSDTWTPATWTDDWRQTYEPGSFEVVSGDPDVGEAMRSKPSDLGGKCGQFGEQRNADTGETIPPCRGNGWEEIGSPEFFAGLPTDPQALYEKIKENVGSSGNDPHVQALMNGSRLLQPVTPPEVRANILRALALIPGVEIVDGAPLPDGRTATALAVDAPAAEVAYTLFVDPATGDVIGYKDGPKAKIDTSTWSVVDEMGAKPAK